MKNLKSDGKLTYGKEEVSVNGRYTVNKEITVKTQTFELETVLSPTKTTPYSCFGHTHHVTGNYCYYCNCGKSVISVVTLITAITVDDAESQFILKLFSKICDSPL